MIPTNVTRTIYKRITKPLLFSFDAEDVHNLITIMGDTFGKTYVTRNLTDYLLSYKSNKLKQEYFGIEFANPVGLAAGFDYDGHMSNIMSSVGFGFNTVGTVTAKPYKGNKKPRLGRLPQSKSLFVNKGFKSSGADHVKKILDKKEFEPSSVVGISVGSSNIPEVDTVNKSIDDYLYTFSLFKDSDYVSYFELNISCPNTSMTESFTSIENFRDLVKQVGSLNITKPIFVKMPNEIDTQKSNEIVSEGLKYGMNGYVFSNLVKDRSNEEINKTELQEFSDKKGNFSGKPTFNSSNLLIKQTRQKFGNDLFIIGCGGVMSAQDALTKIAVGSNLVQLISGIVFEGPQLIGEINSTLEKEMINNDKERITNFWN